MLGIQNMREQCFLTAAVQNMKRLAKAFYTIFHSICMLKAHVLIFKTWALVMPFFLTPLYLRRSAYFAASAAAFWPAMRPNVVLMHSMEPEHGYSLSKN